MSTRKRPIPDIIAGNLTRKLNDEELLALDKKKKTAVGNERDAGSIGDINEKIKQSKQQRPDDDLVHWNNPRIKLRYDPGFEINTKPEQIVFLSKTLRRILITMLVLAAFSITAIFYMTISNLKNHKYPGKPILWHNIRLR